MNKIQFKITLLLIFYIKSLFFNFYNQTNKFQIKQDLMCYIYQQV